MLGVWDDRERAALVALLRVRPDGLGWAEITARVAQVGSARGVWDQCVPASLFEDSGSADDPLSAAAREVEAWASAPFGFTTFMDAAYPPQLRDIHQVPPLVFTRGRLLPQDLGICVVGSRSASLRGLDLAAEVAAALVAEGLTVVSGLAAGVDRAAHESALAAGGRTVAVIGTGITRCYPAVHADLQERIGCEGLVLSQFWPEAAPSKQSFPLRNAVMSGYGRASIVIEAGETSGARIQARLAVEHGRPVILTKAVASGTSWGAALAGAPGVWVAHTVTEIMSAVHAVLDVDRQVEELLALPG